MTSSSKPIACTLAAGDLKTQRERWFALGRTFGLDRVETAEGICLTFVADPASAAELRELVAAETDCCGWAAWGIVEDGETLVMTATAPGDGVPALHALFRGLESSSRPASA